MPIEVVVGELPSADVRRVSKIDLPLQRISVRLQIPDYRDVRFHFIGLPMRAESESGADEFELPIIGITRDIAIHVLVIRAVHRNSPVAYEMVFGDVDSESFVVEGKQPTEKELELAHHAKRLLGALNHKLTLRGRPAERRSRALDRLLDADRRRGPYDARDRATFARLLEISPEGVDKLRRRAGLERLTDLDDPAKIANLVQTDWVDAG